MIVSHFLSQALIGAKLDVLFNTRCDGVPCGLQHLLCTYARGHADTRDGHEDARKRLYRRLYSLLWVCATSTVVGSETI